MATYDEVKAAIEGLWSEEIADWERREEEIDGALDEARARVTRLERAIEDTGQRIGLLGGELDALPGRMAHLDLQGDEAGVRGVRARYSELQEEIAQLREQLDETRAELEAARGEMPPLQRRRHLLNVERVQMLTAQHEQYAKLRRELQARADDIGLLDFAGTAA